MPVKHRKRPPPRWSHKSDRRAQEKSNTSSSPRAKVGDDSSFSLMDTARHTRLTAGFRNANGIAEGPPGMSTLRFKKIAFVSAGDYNVNELLAATDPAPQVTSPSLEFQSEIKQEALGSLSDENEIPILPSIAENLQDAIVKSSCATSTHSSSSSISDSNGGVPLQGYELLRNSLDTSKDGAVDKGRESTDKLAEELAITDALSTMHLDAQRAGGQDRTQALPDKDNDQLLVDAPGTKINDRAMSSLSLTGQDEAKSDSRDLQNDIGQIHLTSIDSNSPVPHQGQRRIDMIISTRENDGVKQYLTLFFGEEIEEAQWHTEEDLLATDPENVREIQFFNQTDTTPTAWLKNNIDPDLSVPSHLEGSDFGQHLEAFEDEYDQYYDMQLSSRERRKVRRMPTLDHPDLTDGYFDSHLAEVWNKDRMVKAEKKRDREALRAQGLLPGKRSQKQNQNRLQGSTVKYSGPVNEDALKAQIMDFVVSNAIELSLPPMDPAKRRVIHLFAHRVKLISESAGKGDNRHTYLAKTENTLDVWDPAWDYFQVLSSKPRAGVRKPLKETASKSFVKRKVAHHQDGDVVGAAAPRLGVENRGHAMMEKMGWSAGKALGTAENQGILDPLSQVVKLSKAGIQ